MTPLDDLDHLRLLDPVLGAEDPARPARLAMLRARVDLDRFGATTGSSVAGRAPVSAPDAAREARDDASGRSWPRRGAVLVAAAAAVLVPTGVSVFSPTSPVARSVAPAAVAADGTIDCGVGYGSGIDPAEAGTRLLPATLPDGVGYAEIRAEESGGEGWCGPASLAAVGLTADGVVTGSLRAVGPFEARLDESSLGEAVPAQVAGRQGYLVPQDDPDLPFFRWFFTDAGGGSWIVEVDGYPLEQATALVAGVSTDPEAGTASFAAVPGAPDLTVVHRRPGEPYTVTSRAQQWYVTLTDGSQIRVDQRYDNHETPVAAGVTVGARLDSEAGRDVVTWPQRTGGGDGVADGLVQVRADLDDGATAYVDAPSREQALALIASLAPVGSGDDRIRTYGLP